VAALTEQLTGGGLDVELIAWRARCVACTTCNVLMKALANGPPQWFERLAN
jgi:hypothetical protein